jgi:hypothetical protein
MVDNNVLQETGSVGERTDVEILRQRLAEVGKRLSCPYVDSLTYVGSGFSRTFRQFSRTFG